MSGASKSEADWRRSVIRPALSCPPGSRARSEAIRLIAARFHPHPKGRERRVSASTARRWVADYEADGLAGLCRKARADRGVEKWAISRLWDEAVSLDDAARQRTRDQLVFHVKRLYRSGIASRRQAQHLATEKLIKLTRAAGCELPEKTAHTICQVPLRLIRKQRHFRAVAIRDKDAKQYADKMRPRARRTREGMAPMEIVCADVHHLDVMLERPDGSRYTPKMIAFLDLKTNRLFCRLLFPEPGRMVRQADVNEAFVAMTQDPDWGVPGRLLLDHGAEFEALAAVGDAMKLAQRVRGSSLTVEYLGDDPALAGQIESLRSDARSAISKARPYNAAAKPIEGIFGNLERSIFSHLPGWVGGDRMNQKTKNVGRLPEAFPGAPNDFRSALDRMIGYYHSLPQTGTLGGKSPRAVFEQAVAAGWERIDVDPDALLEVFSVSRRCTVRQCEVTVEKRRYTAIELSVLPPNSKVTVHVPKWGTRDRLAASYDDGAIFFLEPVYTTDFRDVEGARYVQRRVADQNAALRAMAAEAPMLDLAAEMHRSIDQSPRPVARSAGVIGLGKEAEAIADARRQLPKPKTRGGLATNRHAELWRRIGAHGLVAIEPSETTESQADARPAGKTAAKGGDR